MQSPVRYRNRDGRSQIFRLFVRRIAAASPNKAVPMTKSFAPSGTSGQAVTAAVVVATIGEWVMRTCAIGATPRLAGVERSVDSRESAKPRGTTIAATRAAKRRIRIRFRIAVRSTSIDVPRAAVLGKRER